MEFIAKLEEVKQRYNGIQEQLSDPAIMSNQEKLIKLSKERSELHEIVDTYDEYNELVKNISGNEEIINSGGDKELIEMAEAELEELSELSGSFNGG